MLSSGKVTMLLFMAVIVAYIVFYLVVTLREGSPIGSVFGESKKEHFTSDVGAGAAKEGCETYNLRQEVINIFDVYMGRKATPEEIDKYSAIKNIQDILTNITSDFQLSSTTVQERKGKLDELRKDACEPVQVVASTPETPAPAPAAVAAVTSEEPYEDVKGVASSDQTDQKVCIPLKTYEELKSKLLELQKQVVVV